MPNVYTPLFRFFFFFHRSSLHNGTAHQHTSILQSHTQMHCASPTSCVCVCVSVRSQCQSDVDDFVHVALIGSYKRKVFYFLSLVNLIFFVFFPFRKFYIRCSIDRTLEWPLDNDTHQRFPTNNPFDFSFRHLLSFGAHKAATKQIQKKLKEKKINFRYILRFVQQTYCCQSVIFSQKKSVCVA